MNKGKTHKLAVRRVHPHADAVFDPYIQKWCIRTRVSNIFITLGEGNRASHAWRDAAQKLSKMGTTALDCTEHSS